MLSLLRELKTNQGTISNEQCQPNEEGKLGNVCVCMFVIIVINYCVS